MTLRCAFDLSASMKAALEHGHAMPTLPSDCRPNEETRKAKRQIGIEELEDVGSEVEAAA